MTLRMITCLSLPALLFACGGSDAPTDVTETGGSGRPLAPQLAQPAPPRAEPSTSSSSSSADTQQLLQAQVAAASITLDQATDTALAANPGSELLEADLDGNGANVRFEVELRLADGQIVEVQIDALTGDIIATVPEDAADDDDGDGDDQGIDCTGAISALEAQEAAEVEAGGTAVEVEIDDGCQFEVTVDTGTGFVEVEIGPDGSVQQVELDDDQDDIDDQDDDDDDDDGQGDDDDDDDDDQDDIDD
jgi:uncharacterized membrane protein YkoI